MRRVAVLLGGLEFDDASGGAEVTAFEGGLKDLGWTRGRNIDLDYHWPGAQIARVRTVADAIVAAHPDLVLSRSTPATAALMNASLPIVFVLVADPIGSGFVQNLGHPGGNLTGFSTFESSVGGKWLALLKEAAPEVSRVAMLFNPETAPFAEGYLRSAQAAAQTLGATVISAPCSSDADIQGVFSTRAREGGGYGYTVVIDHQNELRQRQRQHPDTSATASGETARSSSIPSSRASPAPAATCSRTGLLHCSKHALVLFQGSWGFHTLGCAGGQTVVGALSRVSIGRQALIRALAPGSTSVAHRDLP
jgi:hypothetical protein